MDLCHLLEDRIKTVCEMSVRIDMKDLSIRMSIL